MSLKIKDAMVMTISVDIDVEEMSPDISVDVVISPDASFLAGNRAIMANWLRKIANDIAPLVTDAPLPETEES
ncbi:MAG: hypothetical protein M3O41_00505 [Pseudomonadota bacterium]|nr:hypothetical protein [Pseudomonadota bacterium]